MKIRYFFSLLIIPIFLLAQEKAYEPWYTGPLLASGANNIEYGKVNVQPYLYFKETYGTSDQGWGHHSVPDTFTQIMSLDFQFAITEWLDCTIEPTTYYKAKEDQTSFNMGNILTKFGIQILKQKDFTPVPSIRIGLAEIFPTGKYKNLNPAKLGIDAGGNGSFETVIALLIGKTVYWFIKHPISFRFNLIYLFPLKTSISNFNVYGGGYNTKGRVKPGQVFTNLASFEFSITQKWVYAMDFSYIRVGKTTFKGTLGTNADGTTASNSNASSYQFSIAPAIEYNFNINLGMLMGLHFDIKRNNAQKYLSGIISATYTF